MASVERAPEAANETREHRDSELGSPEAAAPAPSGVPELELESTLNISTIDFGQEILSNDAEARDGFSETSFHSTLHEDSYWDFNAYWRLDLALFALAEHTSITTHPNQYQSVFRIYHHIMLNIACSRDPDDGYTITNLDVESLGAVRERLSGVTGALFRGEVPRNHDYRLQNPYL